MAKCNHPNGGCVDYFSINLNFCNNCAYNKPNENKSEVTPSYYNYEYKGIKLDPYRICQIYGVGGGPREQIIKKCLRFNNKGHDPLQVIKEIRQALDRWEEMLGEDTKGE